MRGSIPRPKQTKGWWPSVAQHVDIVKNEWLAGYQHVVARLYLEGDRVRVDARDQIWEEIALRPVGDFDPGRDAQAFLANLSSYVHGTYLFATELHQSDECPFHEVIIPIRALTPEQQREAQAV
jgi:hypothetical protein